MVKEEEKSIGTDRVTRAVRRLRELEGSGVTLLEILDGKAGVAWVRDDCCGDPKIAVKAFALVHSPRLYSEDRKLPG